MSNGSEQNKEREQEPRNICQAFFGALEDTNTSVSSICRVGGVSDVIISRFKKRGSLNYNSLQKAINAMPYKAYVRFVEILRTSDLEDIPPEKSDNLLGLEMKLIARSYLLNREKEKNEGRPH